MTRVYRLDDGLSLLDGIHAAVVLEGRILALFAHAEWAGAWKAAVYKDRADVQVIEVVVRP